MSVGFGAYNEDHGVPKDPQENSKGERSKDEY